MLRKFLWALVGIIIVLPIVAILVGTKMSQFGSMMAAAEQMVMPPETVNAYEVSEQRWQPRVSSVGSVVAVQGTVVRTEAEGIVRNIAFQPGATVNAGDELLRLDAELERAQLREAEAAADSARVFLKRSRELIKSRSISQAELDSAETRVKQAEAQAEYFRAVIARKTVRAPFAGTLGIRSLSVGQYLPKGSEVVSLQSLDPVYVEFSLPQQRMGELAQGLAVQVTSDAYPGEAFAGEITAFNPDVDPATRSVRVQATLANPSSKLRPGMFVSLSITLDRSEQVLLIPTTAVQYGPYGESVFVIEEGEAGEDGSKPLVLRQQRIRLGAAQGDFVVVTEGLKAGEQVVSTGVFKLRPGISVVIDNSLAPEFKLEPNPDNS